MTRTPPNALPDDDVDDWQAHAAWALALARAVGACAVGVRVLGMGAAGPADAPGPHHRTQWFADALASHFLAEVVVSVTSEAAVEEIGRASSGSPREIRHVATLPAGQRATLTLRRGDDADAFRTSEARWVTLLHESCLGIYAPAATDARNRLTDLSPREREALGHLLGGASEKEVATLLKRSPHTVHSYVKRIYRTLGVRSKSELRANFRDAREAVPSTSWIIVAPFRASRQ